MWYAWLCNKGASTEIVTNDIIITDSFSQKKHGLAFVVASCDFLFPPGWIIQTCEANIMLLLQIAFRGLHIHNWGAMVSLQSHQSVRHRLLHEYRGLWCWHRDDDTVWRSQDQPDLPWQVPLRAREGIRWRMRSPENGACGLGIVGTKILAA